MFALTDVGSLGLPKVYAPGTTETFTVQVHPTDFGEHEARVIVLSERVSDGAVNAWEFELRCVVYEHAAGFIQGVTATASAQHSGADPHVRGQWTATAVIDNTHMTEPSATRRGFKTARHAINGWMWGAGESQRISEAWIELDLQDVYPLDEMWIWNCAWIDTPPNFWRGTEAQMKSVYVDFRGAEGDTWRRLGGHDTFYTFFGWGDQPPPENPFRATNLVDGDNDWANNPPLDFGGIRARYVRISTAGGHDVGSYGDSPMAVSLAQLRFYAEAGEVRCAPDALDFGSVPLGSPATLLFEIENASDAPARLDVVAALGTPTPYSVNYPTEPPEIAPGTSFLCSVLFDPAELGASDYRDYKIAAVGGFGVRYVTLRGSAFAAGTPDVRIEPASLNFGTVYLPLDASPAAPVSRTFEVRNLGDSLLEVTPLEPLATDVPEEPAGDPFAAVPATPFTVPAAADAWSPGVHEMALTFSPTAPGNYSGYVALATNDPDAPRTTVTLTGRAVVTQPAAVHQQDWVLYGSPWQAEGKRPLGAFQK